MVDTNRSTIAQPSSPVPEDDELAQLAQDIACPECGDMPVTLVRILSPEEATDESVESFKGGLKGALAGGVAGAIFGPGGIAVGMAGGAFAGSTHGQTQAKKERLVVSCPCCGYHGRAN